MIASLVPSVVIRNAARFAGVAALRTARTAIPVRVLVDTFANAAEEVAKIAQKRAYTTAYVAAQQEAEKVGHSCADWEFNTDEDSPLEWCAGCRHMESWRQANPDPFAVVWNGIPSAKCMTAEQVEAERKARWENWVRGLPAWDLLVLKAGGVEANILIKEKFYGQRMSWAQKEEMLNPDYFKSRESGRSASHASLKSKALPLPAPVVVKRPTKAVVNIKKAAKPAVPQKAGWAALDFSESEDSEESESVAEAVLDNGFCAPVVVESHSPADMTFEEYDRFCQEKERAVAAKAAADEADGWTAAGAKVKKVTTPNPFGGLAVEAWLARKNPVNTGGARAARQKELEAWLGETPRRAFTSKGYQPYKKFASAGRSSALFNGADGIDLADIREIAALIAPVRDIFRPRSNNALVFVEFLDAGAATQAKLVFGEHPLRMWNRAVSVDVAKPKASHGSH